MIHWLQNNGFYSLFSHRDDIEWYRPLLIFSRELHFSWKIIPPIHFNYPQDSSIPQYSSISLLIASISFKLECKKSRVRPTALEKSMEMKMPCIAYPYHLKNANNFCHFCSLNRMCQREKLWVLWKFFESRREGDVCELGYHWWLLTHTLLLERSKKKFLSKIKCQIHCFCWIINVAAVTRMNLKYA